MWLNGEEVTCGDVIEEIFYEERRVLTNAEVISLVYAKYPRRPWVKNTVHSWLGALTVNQPARRSRDEVRKGPLLFRVGIGRRRLWDPERDGDWRVTGDGVELVDDSTRLAKILTTHAERLEAGLRVVDREELKSGGSGLAELDLLAVDREGRYVVVEIEAGRATLETLKRMWNRMRLVGRREREETHTRGIIVARRFHEDLQYIVDVSRNVRFGRYLGPPHYVEPWP